jgi:DNA-binding transcriptional regulator YhcF (GntR family)
MPTDAATARSERVLAVVTANPGITIPEVAEKAEVDQNILYRVLPELEQERKVEKRGRGWRPCGKHVPNATVLEVIKSQPRLTINELAALLQTDTNKLAEPLRELQAEYVITKQGDGYVVMPHGPIAFRFEAWQTTTEVHKRVFEIKAGSRGEAQALVEEWVDEEDEKKLPPEIKFVNAFSEVVGVGDSGIDEAPPDRRRK